MRLLLSVMSAFAFVAAASGCSDSTGPGSVAGIWREDNDLPGNLLEITVILDGSVVTGYGAWCGEALGCGITIETGTANGSHIHVVTTFDSGRVETFDGGLISSSSLVGTMTEASVDGHTQISASQSFTRVQRDPP